MKKIIYITAILTLIISPWALAQKIEPEMVEFLTEDGVTIKASYYQSLLVRRWHYPAILMLPELRQGREHWHKAATFFSEKGFIVLAIDFRGQGESTQAGEFTLNWAFFSDSYFVKHLLDIRASINFLKGLPKVDQKRIIIMGAGLGANAALVYAADNISINSLVLLSAGLSYRGLKTKDAMEEYGKRPVLLIAGEDDGYSLYSSRELYSLAQGKKELKIYSNASRGAKMLSRKPEIMELISRWLKNLLD